jgi:hypothetical protein
MLCLRYGIAVSMIRKVDVNQIRLISLPEFETQYINFFCPHLIGICS